MSSSFSWITLTTSKLDRGTETAHSLTAIPYTVRGREQLITTATVLTSGSSTELFNIVGRFLGPTDDESIDSLTRGRRKEKKEKE